ncbi:hypothetical protein [Lachnospira multipara]|nr:hypothetical protein [Lachnospira multipara]
MGITKHNKGDNKGNNNDKKKPLNDIGLKPQKTIETFSYNGNKKKS